MNKIFNPLVFLPSYSGRRLIVTLALSLGFVAAGSSSIFAQQSPSGCPDWQLPGRAVQVDDRTPLEERAFTVEAGGNVSLDAETCSGNPGIGWVAIVPNFTIEYDSRGHTAGLEISVNGSCDTVLLVEDPTGQWHFNDDANGLDPTVVLHRAPSGSYHVWVGTYAPRNCSATIQMQIPQQPLPMAPPNPNAANALLLRLLGNRPISTE